ncbi:MAG: vancomycin resistance protein [Ruminococcaceae bacterium]|nr:vancomycin resistance protein [Oscillospiraceae bacterium]
MKKRKLFCEISPLTYKISVQKCIAVRKVKDTFSKQKFASVKQEELLPIVAYKHTSLIRRKLGNVDLQLQENKAVNLSIAAPKVNRTIIKPGETFSFWQLVGNPSEKNGYKTGLTIAHGKPSRDIGGGMCQFTNLIHWMVLHSPLSVIEHHHHDGVDLFPDFNRQVPFGTGTSILYNYKDYRFTNNTDQIFQLVTYTDNEYLYGELRCEKPLNEAYHIKAENEHFSREDGVVYRNGEIYRAVVDKVTGNTIDKTLIKTNHAEVMYDTSNLNITVTKTRNQKATF